MIGDCKIKDFTANGIKIPTILLKKDLTFNYYSLKALVFWMLSKKLKTELWENFVTNTILSCFVIIVQYCKKKKKYGFTESMYFLNVG